MLYLNLLQPVRNNWDYQHINEKSACNIGNHNAVSILSSDHNIGMHIPSPDEHVWWNGHFSPGQVILKLGEDHSWASLVGWTNVLGMGFADLPPLWF